MMNDCLHQKEENGTLRPTLLAPMTTLFMALDYLLCIQPLMQRKEKPAFSIQRSYGVKNALDAGDERSPAWFGTQT